MVAPGTGSEVCFAWNLLELEYFENVISYKDRASRFLSIQFEAILVYGKAFSEHAIKIRKASGLWAC